MKTLSFLPLLALAGLTLPLIAEDGDGSVVITGELKAWHAVTLTVSGPFANETDQDPNPFTDIEFSVQFSHESGDFNYLVPGYFAADGEAAETSATSGNQWRAHLSPDLSGKWSYETSLKTTAGTALPGDGQTGSFEVAETDKSGRDFRGRGRLSYVGERYLQFAGDKSYFLKAGPDAPETFLAYEDFDGTEANNPKKCPLKSWSPHLKDWNEGDPTWQDGKGKGMIGALNYLAEKGLNAFSFLPYNAGGDGDNVWPFISRNEKFHYDCSKLDQWGIVFDHATANGLYLHFKLQETEIDDNRQGQKKEEDNVVPTSLDGGDLGPERKLYLREMIARYGHHLALNWNIGEENTQSPEQIRAMAEFIQETDPYNHHLVIHTYPSQQDKVYPPLLGDQSVLTGASLQNPWNHVHRRTAQWLRESAAAGKQWVVANDEQNPADLGVPPDPGYEGFDGIAVPKEGKQKYDLHDIRRETLWGNLMAGGAGAEYYFGYRLPQNDLLCEDYRSRDKSWDFCRIALEFFHKNEIPFWEMEPNDALVDNPEGKSGLPWCLAKGEECYVLYFPKGIETPVLADDGKTRLVMDPATGETVNDSPEIDRVILIR